jgi:hypothetical protein
MCHASICEILPPASVLSILPRLPVPDLQLSRSRLPEVALGGTILLFLVPQVPKEFSVAGPPFGTCQVRTYSLSVTAGDELVTPLKSEASRRRTSTGTANNKAEFRLKTEMRLQLRIESCFLPHRVRVSSGRKQ